MHVQNYNTKGSCKNQSIPRSTVATTRSQQRYSDSLSRSPQRFPQPISFQVAKGALGAFQPHYGPQGPLEGRLLRETSQQSIKKESVFRVLDHPLHSLHEIVACNCTALYDCPPMRLDLIERQSLKSSAEGPDCMGCCSPSDLPYLFYRHASPNICFVGEDEETRAHQPLQERQFEQSYEPVNACLFLEQSSKLCTAFIDAQRVCCIHHPNQSVCLLEVVPPVRP